MGRIDQLRDQIEKERVRLNRILEEGTSNQAAYEQSLVVDGLIESYMEEIEKSKK